MFLNQNNLKKNTPMGRIVRFSKYCLGHAYTKNISILVYLKSKLNWVSDILLGNSAHRTEDIGIHSEEISYSHPHPCPKS